MAESFGKGDVGTFFSGHVHNCQRATYPLRFVAGKPGKSKSEVSGEWTLDRSYDGKTRTKPRGIIYLVTQGGMRAFRPRAGRRRRILAGIHPGVPLEDPFP